jgi:hypothetical protein
MRTRPHRLRKPANLYAADMRHVSGEILKETEKTVTFIPHIVNSMVKTIILAGKMTMEADELKQFVLDSYDLNDLEWTAHERLLKRIFELRFPAKAA